MFFNFLCSQLSQFDHDHLTSSIKLCVAIFHAIWVIPHISYKSFGSPLT